MFANLFNKKPKLLGNPNSKWIVVRKYMNDMRKKKYERQKKKIKELKKLFSSPAVGDESEFQAS